MSNTPDTNHCDHCETVVRLDERTRDVVRREEFAPVQRIVYGLVGLILLTVFGAILGLAVSKQAPKTQGTTNENH